MQTLAQERAAHALAQIKAIEANGNCGNYVSYVSGLPAGILTNGLGQAMAQLLAKAKGDLNKPHGLLYSHVQSWLCNKRRLFGNQMDLINGIVESDQNAYVRAQAEALAYLNWLKKFARAYLEKPAPNSAGEARS